MTNEINAALDAPEDTPLCDAFLLAQWGKHEADITAPCEFYALDKNTLRIKFNHRYHTELAQTDDNTGDSIRIAGEVTHFYECIISLPTVLEGVATVIHHGEGDDEGMTKMAHTVIPFGNVLECAFESIWDLFHAVLKSEHQHVRKALKLYPYNK